MYMYMYMYTYSYCFSEVYIFLALSYMYTVCSNAYRERVARRLPARVLKLVSIFCDSSETILGLFLL